MLRLVTVGEAWAVARRVAADPVHKELALLEAMQVGQLLA
jgi:hypothetical protein